MKHGSDWCSYYFLLEQKVVRHSVQWHKLFQSLPYQHPNVNIQSTLHTTPNLCKNVSLVVLFGSRSNSYTASTQSGKCMYTHFFKMSRCGLGKRNNKKLGQQWMSHAKEIFCVLFWAHRPKVRQPYYIRTHILQAQNFSYKH